MEINEQAAKALQLELPAKPDWFDKELAQVMVIDGYSMFRCVNGQKEPSPAPELELKHRFQGDEIPEFVKVSYKRWRRKNKKTGEYKTYKSALQATMDDNPDLFKLVEETKPEYEIKAVGRPCWVLEVFVKPDEVPDEKTWNAIRFERLDTVEGIRNVDLLGPHPKHGYFKWFMDILDEDGEPLAPSRRVIEDLKQRIWEFDHDKRSFNQRLVDRKEREQKFLTNQRKRMVDAVFQSQAFSGRSRYEGAEVSKHIKESI